MCVPLMEKLMFLSNFPRRFAIPQPVDFNVIGRDKLPAQKLNSFPSAVDKTDALRHNFLCHYGRDGSRVGVPQ